MEFLLWAVRSLHLFSVVVWIGGLMYQSAVATPVAGVEGNELVGWNRHLIRRFVPFVWMCVWTVFVTGLALMLFSPRFIFFDYDDRWSVALGLKQLTFVIMVVFAFGYARMFSRLDEILSQAGPKSDPAPYHRRLVEFGRINAALGIAALLLAAAMQ